MALLANATQQPRGGSRTPRRTCRCPTWSRTRDTHAPGSEPHIRGRTSRQRAAPPRRPSSGSPCRTPLPTGQHAHPEVRGRRYYSRPRCGARRLGQSDLTTYPITCNPRHYAPRGQSSSVARTRWNAARVAQRWSRLRLVRRWHRHTARGSGGSPSRADEPVLTSAATGQVSGNASYRRRTSFCSAKIASRSVGRPDAVTGSSPAGSTDCMGTGRSAAPGFGG